MKTGKSIYEGDELFQLLPQRPPMVMIDRFFGIENTISFSGLTLTSDNLFCKEGVLQETGIIEHIAQSAAARIGYIYQQRKEPVPLGFIGSVEKMNIYRLPQTGTSIYTKIAIIQEVFDITLIEAKVECNEEIIAECRMKIFLRRE